MYHLSRSKYEPTTQKHSAADSGIPQAEFSHSLMRGEVFCRKGEEPRPLLAVAPGAAGRSRNASLLFALSRD
jgi:hypothetical protein